MTTNNLEKKSMPELSIILVTEGSFDPLRRLAHSLAAQTVRDQLEIVIVCPSQASLGLADGELACFHSVQVIELGEVKTTSHARVAAIRAANAPVIALCEDHAFPEPDWAEAFVRAHRQPWAAVGPAFTNANPGVVSWVAMVIDYGRWVEPVESGVIDDIPGHNSSWKRSLLLEYGDRLESMLPAPTFLNWDLQAKGHQLYLEAGAKIRHMQVSRLSRCMTEQFYVARLFPAERSRNWPWYRRFFYACAMPVLVSRNLRGWIKHFRRIDPTGRILLKVSPILLLMTVVWGAGEILGYIFGIGPAQERTLTFDTDRARHVNRRDRKLLATRFSEA
jgi:glycosyl transferase family 2